MSERVFGKDLRVGDTIETWFSDGRDTIVSLKPYDGPLNHLWGGKGKARIAAFAVNKTGMTIEPEALFTLIMRRDFSQA